MEQQVNPKMIIVARESRGMTQRELAEATKSISQTRLSKMENGVLGIDESDLSVISQATQFRPTFFYCQDQIIGLGSSLVFNRKFKTTPVGVQRQVQARVNVARIQLERLLGAAEVEPVSRLERVDVDDCEGGPRAIARRVRAALRIPMGPIQSVSHAIESAGGIIVLCDFGTDRVHGAHLWLPGSPPMFFMNEDVSGDRHRFNLAHELGHAVMHEFPTGDIEKQANEFAAEFLMPSDEISLELHNLNLERLARLKQRWRVSMAALIYNAEKLGCISEKRKQILYATLRGSCKGAEEFIDVAMEEPVLLGQLIEIHRRSLGYTDEDFRRMFMMDDPDFIQFPSALAFPSKALRMDSEPIKIEKFRRAAQ